MKKKIIGLMLISGVVAMSCAGSKSDNKDSVPAEIVLGARALQDLSAMDVAQAGMIAPAPMTARSAGSADSISAAAVPAQNLPPNDPRWLWVLHPLRTRGSDDLMPRIVEPLIAARYVLTERPSCATITETPGLSGACPPNPTVLGSSCTSHIVFDANGCTVSASVGGNQTALFLTGTIDVTATITQAGVAPSFKMHTEILSTNFTITEPAGNWVMYSGTLLEDFDGTAPASGFTVVHSAIQSDPIVITASAGIIWSMWGTRTTAVVPNVSVNVNGAATITILRPNMDPLTLETTVTRTATIGATSLHLTIDRTFTNPATSRTWSRSADLTLTPSDNPVTEVVITGTETFTEPVGTVITVDLNDVAMDMNCAAPRGGNIVITAPDVILTVVFDNNCNCTAGWSDNLGNSGTLNFCAERSNS